MATQNMIRATANSPRCEPAQKKVRLELGRQWLPVIDAHALDVGSIVLLDCQADECVEIVADGQVIALGTPVSVSGKLAAHVKELAVNA